MANQKILNTKKKLVDDLAKKFEKASVILLTDYRGISVEDVTTLRKSLRDEEAEYAVIKNNIIKRAFEKAGLEGLTEDLAGPTAVITSEKDYLVPSKIIYKFTKENDYYKIRGGVIEGKIKTSDEVAVLAQLPSKEELLAKLAGVLLANISKLAVALDQVKEQKSEGVEVEEKEEAPAEEAKAEETKEEKAEETEAKEDEKEVKAEETEAKEDEKEEKAEESEEK